MGEKDIQQRCLELIDENTSGVMKSEGFVNIELETLKMIISRDTLEVKELDVWLACVRWAENQCQRQGKQVGIIIVHYLFFHFRKKTELIGRIYTLKRN